MFEASQFDTLVYSRVSRCSYRGSEFVQGSFSSSQRQAFTARSFRPRSYLRWKQMRGWGVLPNGANHVAVANNGFLVSVEHRSIKYMVFVKNGYHTVRPVVRSRFGWLKNPGLSTTYCVQLTKKSPMELFQRFFTSLRTHVFALSCQSSYIFSIVFLRSFVTSAVSVCPANCWVKVKVKLMFMGPCIIFIVE